MFVVVTAFACWLGYSLNWIRQRHAYLDEVQRRSDDIRLIRVTSSARGLTLRCTGKETLDACAFSACKILVSKMGSPCGRRGFVSSMSAVANWTGLKSTLTTLRPVLARCGFGPEMSSTATRPKIHPLPKWTRTDGRHAVERHPPLVPRPRGADSTAAIALSPRPPLG